MGKGGKGPPPHVRAFRSHSQGGGIFADGSLDLEGLHRTLNDPMINKAPVILDAGLHCIVEPTFELSGVQSVNGAPCGRCRARNNERFRWRRPHRRTPRLSSRQPVSRTPQRTMTTAAARVSPALAPQTT